VSTFFNLHHAEEGKEDACHLSKGEIMSINNARKFVEKLREDRHFRIKALNTAGNEELSSFLHAERLIFDQRELVGAMAECMEQLELQMGG
jgi:hypothetical protein